VRKVYSTNDRIRLKIGDLTVFFRPLTYAEKSEIQASMMSGSVKGAMQGAYDTLRAALVDVQGLEYHDGSSFKYDEDKFDDILNLPESPTMTKAALNLLSNVPDEFKDPESGLKLDGVEILKEESAGKK